MPQACRLFAALSTSEPVTQLEAAPFIVDAWTLTPQSLAGDANGCTVGTTFVRVVWSNGVTAYPAGDEVGAAVVASYKADYQLPSGEMRSLTPIAIGDLSDHPPKVFLDDRPERRSDVRVGDRAATLRSTTGRCSVHRRIRSV